MTEVARGLAEMFDPESLDAERVLADLIVGHFTDRPLRVPDTVSREKLAENFSWDRAARDFIDSIEYLNGTCPL